jgi:hypothetical protein
MHQGNEIIDRAWFRWMWFWLSPWSNGAIGKVVQLGFELQQEIGEVTRECIKKMKLLTNLDVGGCDLHYVFKA